MGKGPILGGAKPTVPPAAPLPASAPKAPVPAAASKPPAAPVAGGKLADANQPTQKMSAPPPPSGIAKASPAPIASDAPTMKMQAASPASTSTGASTVKLGAAPAPAGGQTMAMPTMQLPVTVESEGSTLDVILSGMAMASSVAAAVVLWISFH
jgi:hypothetical protein